MYLLLRNRGDGTLRQKNRWLLFIKWQNIWISALGREWMCAASLESTGILDGVAVGVREPLAAANSMPSSSPGEGWECWWFSWESVWKEKRLNYIWFSVRTRAGNCNPRERGEVLISADSGLWGHLPRKSTCPGGTGDFSEISSSCITHQNTFYIESCDWQPAEHGEREMSLHRGWFWVLNGLWQLPFRFWNHGRKKKGKEEKGKCECGLMNNSQLKDLSSQWKYQRELFTSFWWTQIEKTGFGRMHLMKWFPVPWVVQSRRKAQGLLEPVKKVFLLGK